MEISVAIIFYMCSLFFQSEALRNSNESGPVHNVSLSRFYGRNLKSIDWCSLVCHKPQPEQNIACTHKGDCLTPKAPCKFLQMDRSKILAAHNRLRYQFANGKEPRASGIQVADMMALSWDDDLAFLAGCNLKMCNSEMEHDPCHNTPKFDTAGQNIAWARGVPDCVEQAYVSVKNWYDEVKLLSESEIKSMGENYQMKSGTGHFTQVIWATSSHVGCMLWSKGSGPDLECMFTCNYGPAGNFLQSRMFKMGPPASACPQNVKPNKGLCGGDKKSATSATSGCNLYRILHLETVIITILIMVSQFSMCN